LSVTVPAAVTSVVSFELWKPEISKASVYSPGGRNGMM
jgi:hypothetical protein